MKFQKNSRRQPIEYEKDLAKRWKQNQIFKESIKLRPKNNAYVFYDGPPFITGTPHYGTLLPSIVKDVVPRYQTMKGKRVERTWGWDCHGLPAENFVEKKLGITDRHDIGTKISLADYIITARENMVQTGNSWEETIDRIGRWVDFANGYKTMDKNYMESVWWAFKTLYDKGRIYEGERVLMYDTQWATPLSKAEVTMDTGAYIEVTDPSVYVKFKLIDSNVTLLAWTTTPWTLLGNAALAVNSKIEYVEVNVKGERFVLAKDALDAVLVDEKHNKLDYKIIRSFLGNKLTGKAYMPLFTDRGKGAHKIFSADFVDTGSGTGIVHIAPAYGEDDFALASDKKIPVVHVIDDYGKYIEGEWLGFDIWEVNKTIAKTLQQRGIVWKIDYIRHEYPHNPRTGNRLIYRAHPSWFMNIDNQRQEMLEQNGNIYWFPEHIKNGRFAKNIQSAPDWNISRDRFWATAMPVWKGIDKTGREQVKVVGSYKELEELSGIKLDDYHRPWVDKITFEIDGVKYNRIDKVLDCWFESGSMPFAQFHYPFENIDKFEQNFPGDFIVEYVGQVRAWFYYVHAVSVGLFGKNAFKNVIVTGTIAGNDGRKMSKSYGNYTDPTELMDTYSADSLRFLLLNSPLLNGEDFALINKDVADIHRKLNMVWNMYDFFSLYADVDGWEWHGECQDPTSGLSNILDIWIVSKLHQLINEVDDAMQNYDIQSATKPILPFIDDASNWYIRRSRKRFWKSDNDKDKNDAYSTLHYVLVQLAKIMAPFTPFMSEELFKKLTAKKSVHLEDWPLSGHINNLVITEMNNVRELITQGLSVRAEAGIKVRQPLAKAAITAPFAAADAERTDYESIIAEELNVKTVEISTGKDLSISIDTVLSDELKAEGLARELIRYIQNFRKQIGLNVSDRINLTIETQNAFINSAIKNYEDNIRSEVLAIGSKTNDKDVAKSEIKIEGSPVIILVSKA